MRYAVVIEQGLMGFTAYVPDLPGCVAAGNTRDDVVRHIHRAIEDHIEGLRGDGRAVPAPVFSVEFVDVAVSAISERGSPALPGRRTC